MLDEQYHMIYVPLASIEDLHVSIALLSSQLWGRSVPLHVYLGRSVRNILKVRL